MDTKNLLPIGKTSKAILIGFNLINIIWFIVSIIRFILIIDDILEGRNATLSDALTFENVVAGIHYIIALAMYTIPVVMLFLNKLSIKTAGIIILINTAIGFLINISSFIVILTDNSKFNIIYPLIVTFVRTVLFVICASFIFLTKRRWLGFHIALYLGEAITFYSTVDALRMAMGYGDNYIKFQYVISLINVIFIVYQAVLVLIGKSKVKAD